MCEHWQNFQLFFCRDNDWSAAVGQDDDVLSVADDGTFSAYEIKSGKTYRPEYFDGLRYLKGLFPDTMTSSRVVYDGDESNPSPTDGLMNYRAIGWVKP